jgi:hypothetical protein
VTLSGNSLRPEDTLRFADTLPETLSGIFVWGPPGELGFFLIGTGGIFGRGEDFLTHNASVEPGFSGSPVFGIPDTASGSTCFAPPGKCFLLMKRA